MNGHEKTGSVPRSKLKEHETRDDEAGSSSASSGDDDHKQKHRQSVTNEVGEEVAVETSPLGRFLRFNRKLGSGSYKTVYLGFDCDTGKEVAWNMISLQGMDKRARTRITEEINLLKSLQHARIIAFINAWINKTENQVCFITERVTGGSLLSYIKRTGETPLKLKVMRTWCRQILEGLDYLHTRPEPIIHRDLKCENIFINGNVGEVLIGDLGLSTTLKQSCATSIVGTPDFIAPEVYEEKYDTAVDIYAFGMCLLEMLMKGSPYTECTTPGQVYKKVIAGEKPLSLRRIKDPLLRGLIDQCIGKAELRPTAGELLKHPWLVAEEDGNKTADLWPREEVPPEPSEEDQDTSKDSRGKEDRSPQKRGMEKITEEEEAHDDKHGRDPSKEQAKEVPSHGAAVEAPPAQQQPPPPQQPQSENRENPEVKEEAHVAPRPELGAATVAATEDAPDRTGGQVPQAPAGIVSTPAPQVTPPDPHAAAPQGPVSIGIPPGGASALHALHDHAHHAVRESDNLEDASSVDGSVSYCETIPGMKSHIEQDMINLEITDPQDSSHPEFHGFSHPRGQEASEEQFREALEAIGNIVVTQVMMVLSNQSCKLNVAFDFDPKEDTALGVAKELQDTGIAPQQIPMEDLIREIELAIMNRCKQLKAGEGLVSPSASTASMVGLGHSASAMALPAGTPTGAFGFGNSGKEHGLLKGASLYGSSSSLATQGHHHGQEGADGLGSITAEPTVEGWEYEGSKWNSFGWSAAKPCSLSASIFREAGGDEAEKQQMKVEVTLLQRSLAYIHPEFKEEDFKDLGEWCEATNKAVESFREYHKLPGEKNVVDMKFWEVLAAQVKKKDNKEFEKKAKRELDRKKTQQVREQKKQQQDQESALQLEAMMGRLQLGLDEKASRATSKQAQPAGSPNTGGPVPVADHSAGSKP